MSDVDWQAGFAKSLGVFLNGDAIAERDPYGRRLVDDSFLLCFNASTEDIAATLPDPRYGQAWAVVVDTALGEVLTLSTGPGVVAAEPRTVAAGSTLSVPSRSLLVLQRTG